MKSAMEMRYNALAVEALEQQYRGILKKINETELAMERQKIIGNKQNVEMLDATLPLKQIQLEDLAEAITHFRKGPEQ